VLAHGFTQTARCWGPVAADLAVDHELVAVDLPGHGGAAAVAADLWAAADQLAVTGGRATYLGYSLGARLCLHLAVARPELVERLVLVGGTAGIDQPDQRAQRRAADEVLARRVEAVGVARFVDEWLAGPLFATLSEAAACRPQRLANTPAGLASSLRLAGTGTQEPLWGRLGHLEVPVLVVAGADDLRFRALGERLADAIGPSAEVAWIPAAGHSAHLERPAAFLAALRPWLDRTGGRGGEQARRGATGGQGENQSPPASSTP
jgi:2-succinyl-6-hydroxy-2,4-cyclohexadiene-1-carboxylate synthase